MTDWFALAKSICVDPYKDAVMIPYFAAIAEQVEEAHKIIENFRNGEYTNPHDPNLCRIALRNIRGRCRDALMFADKSQRELGEV
jgi:hypothetical protein